MIKHSRASLPRVLTTAVFTIALAGVAAAQAVQGVRGPLVPQWVEMVAEPDSELVAQQFDLDFALNQRGSLPQEPCWPCRVREAIRENPLSSGALRILSMYAASTGDQEASKELLSLAWRLSRRDPFVQVWRIEQAVSSGDSEEAAKLYDQALSVRPRIGTALYPQMATRLSHARFAKALAGIMAGERIWAGDFAQFLLNDPARLDLLVRLLKAGPESGPLSEATAYHEKLLLGALAAQQDYATAQWVAERLLGSSSPLQDASFSQETYNNEFAPLLWSAPGEDDLSTGLEEDGTIRIEALSGARGVALYRTMIIPPGPYHFSMTASPVAHLPPLPGEWQVHCMSQDVPSLLTSSELRPLSESSQISVRFFVPPQCRAVRLAFMGTNSVGENLAAIEFKDAQLDRERSRGL